MKNLTKLMLATAILATSGFANETILGGDTPIGEGAVEVIKNSNVILQGSMTLAKSNTEGRGAQLTIDSGKTLEIMGGSLTSSGEGSENAKITLKGTLKVSAADLDNDGIIDNPTVDLSGIDIEGVVHESGTLRCENHNLTFDLESDKTILGGLAVYGNIQSNSNLSYCAVNYNGQYMLCYDKLCEKKESNVSVGNGWEIDADNGVLGYFQPNLGWQYGEKVYGFAYEEGELEVVSEDENDGILDLSALRAFSSQDFVVKDLSDSIKNIKPTKMAAVKLPFNCKFTDVDLSNVNAVSYDVLRIEGISEAQIKGSYIERVVTSESGTYGDYKNDESLGVTTNAVGVETVVDGEVRNLNLADIANSKIFNVPGLKLRTGDLINASHEISANTTFNFGLSGNTGVSVSLASGADNRTKLILAGDNSEYAASAGTISLPAEVEFAGTNSLLPISYTYTKGTFSEGHFTNSIAAGVSVEFREGVTLGKGHTLSIFGNLTI